MTIHLHPPPCAVGPDKLLGSRPRPPTLLDAFLSNCRLFLPFFVVPSPGVAEALAPFRLLWVLPVGVAADNAMSSMWPLRMSGTRMWPSPASNDSARAERRLRWCKQHCVSCTSAPLKEVHPSRVCIALRLDALTGTAVCHRPIPTGPSRPTDPIDGFGLALLLDRATGTASRHDFRAIWCRYHSSCWSSRKKGHSCQAGIGHPLRVQSISNAASLCTKDRMNRTCCAARRSLRQGSASCLPEPRGAYRLANIPLRFQPLHTTFQVSSAQSLIDRSASASVRYLR